MANLNEIDFAIENDWAMDWAIQREFELRYASFEFYQSGGVAGSIKRLTESIKHWRRVMIGEEADAPS